MGQGSFQDYGQSVVRATVTYFPLDLLGQKDRQEFVTGGWCANTAASWVKCGTGPGTWRAGRE